MLHKHVTNEYSKTLPPVIEFCLIKIHQAQQTMAFSVSLNGIFIVNCYENEVRTFVSMNDE